MVKNLFYEYFENLLSFEKIVYSRKFPKSVNFSDTKFIRLTREISEKLLIFGYEILFVLLVKFLKNC